MGTATVALTICESLPWQAPSGRARVDECMPLLEQFAAARMLRLPAYADLLLEATRDAARQTDAWLAAKRGVHGAGNPPQ